MLKHMLSYAYALLVHMLDDAKRCQVKLSKGKNSKYEFLFIYERGIFPLLTLFPLFTLSILQNKKFKL